MDLAFSRETVPTKFFLMNNIVHRVQYCLESVFSHRQSVWEIKLKKKKLFFNDSRPSDTIPETFVLILIIVTWKNHLT